MRKNFVSDRMLYARKRGLEPITMPFTVAFLKSNPGCCKVRIRYEKLELQQMSHTSSWNRSSKMSFLTSISVAASKLSCPLSGNQKKCSKTPADTLNPSRQYWCKISNLHKYGEPCLCFKHFEKRNLQLTIFWTKACGKKLSWIRHASTYRTSMCFPILQPLAADDPYKGDSL